MLQNQQSTFGITWPGPPSTPVEPSEGASQWVVDWIESYNMTDSLHNPAGENAVQKEIAQAAEWGARNGRPLWMSEFTAQDGAVLTSRVNWIRCVRQELEKQGIPWSFWTLLSDGASTIYDITSDKRDTVLTDALGLDIKN